MYNSISGISKNLIDWFPTLFVFFITDHLARAITFSVKKKLFQLSYYWSANIKRCSSSKNQLHWRKQTKAMHTSRSDSFLTSKGLPGKHRCLCNFLQRTVSRNSSKGQEETVYDGSCVRQPFEKLRSFVSLAANKYFTSIEQYTGHNAGQTYPVFGAKGSLFVWTMSESLQIYLLTAGNQLMNIVLHSWVVH